MWHACTDVQKKRTHHWPEFKENINISSNDSFLFYHAGFLSFISSYGRRIISFHRDIQCNAVTGQFRQLGNNDIHSISPVSLPRFAGSHPKHQTEFHVSTPASMGARIVALPPASLLLSWQKKCRVESWVSVKPGLYWCLLSRRLHARGMLLVYLARHSLWWQIGPFTFYSPSR